MPEVHFDPKTPDDAVDGSWQSYGSHVDRGVDGTRFVSYPQRWIPATPKPKPYVPRCAICGHKSELIYCKDCRKSGRHIDRVSKKNKTCSILWCNIYWCPSAGELECPDHGGFDVCCDSPDDHVNVASLYERCVLRSRQ